MDVGITESALKKVRSLMADEGFTTERWFLRVGVKGGGCSGLTYTMDFDDTINEGDTTCETGSDLKIVVDKKSLLYIFGTVLEFSDGLNGKGFQFNNPNASRTCGCGESFAL